MATYTGASVVTPSLATPTPCPGHSLPPVLAGEALNAGAPCYVKASDSKAYMSNGTAATEAAKVDGWCLKDTEVGRPVTLHFNVLIAYGTPTAPAVGALLYVATTAGSLDTSAQTGGTAPVAKGVAAPANTSPTHGFIWATRSTY
jgi:hypothetical protein